LQSDFYPHRPSTVDLVQTHISFVFLAGEEVYKVKKPVRFSFLDFSTLERRHHFCREEVRLNRRLAPDTYLGVATICREGAGFRLGTEDDPAAVEFAVHMRRLRHDRILVNLLAAGAVTVDMIDAIAERMADFHAAADNSEGVIANGSREAVWRVLLDNFTGARAFRDRTIPGRDDDRIQRFCRRFLDTHAALFARRQHQRRIRECHGDLHTEHICIDGAVVVFDCVEFNPQFRNCDVAAEIAFLAMDLDYRGHPELSARFVASYVARAADPELPLLLPFYQCYRAYVRGKVDSLKSTEAEVDAAERDAAAESARRHFALAYRYSWATHRALVVVFGLSGSGKSVIARALADRTGFASFNSDVLRKELAGLAPHERAGSELYRSEISAATYRMMLDRAAAALAGGRGAIVDATFQLAIHRDEARRVAAAAQVPVVFVECTAPEAVIRERLARRRKDPTEASDADWSVYLLQRTVYESFAANEAGAHLLVDTTRTTADAVAAIEDLLATHDALPVADPGP
jgi:aminoglycoside phosphotransferase family enzyme/predicted kinase